MMARFRAQASREDGALEDFEMQGIDEDYRKAFLEDEAEQQQPLTQQKSSAVSAKSKLPSNNNMEGRKTSAMLFCECSSIRGMPKIARSSSSFLRRMWLSFIIGMTLVLIVSSSLSVRSYLQYDVIVHTSDIPEFPSKFPAITICLHRPFSQRALSLWANGSVMSPRGYNQRLRRWAQEAINKTESNFSRIKQKDAVPIFYALYYDMLEMYYQNVRYEDTTLLSHDPSVIRKCIIMTKWGESHFKDPCNLTDHNFNIKLFSHPKHFNCYTVEPNSEASSLDTIFLGLAVDLGPKPDYLNLQQGFLNDVFDQATGLRLVIHEPNRYPDVEQFGKNIEAGKMTELAYTPTLWNRSNTPVKPCIEGDAEPFEDLGRRFDYSQRECTRMKTQRAAMERCGCIICLPGHPRPRIPGPDVAYCGTFTDAYNRTTDDFIRFSNCYVEDVQPSEDHLKPCLSRCVFSEYETKLSVTEWGATDWQVYWSGKYLNDIEELQRLMNQRDSRPEEEQQGLAPRFDDVKKRIMHYLTKENLTSVQASADQMVESKNFAYVVLKRKGENLILKQEKQVLTLNALMSQIGGLCSLTIGLTCACIVEVVEFFYIYLTAFRTNGQAGTAAINNDGGGGGVGASESSAGVGTHGQRTVLLPGTAPTSLDLDNAGNHGDQRIEHRQLHQRSSQI
ncbi:hypothetical protein BOX15_Mlig004551g1 [Macrostomum lignano]|uniref:Amiloride-sensitive sodium channel n=2 Tax=Macrostomum lignano TaxID=282301 RepID=A0A267EDH7_9PLAT|nr:hypothetical protein BOX15_Mlig004551g1 [Macrostomum lignano]